MALIGFFSSTSQKYLKMEVSSQLPKSLHTIRKHFQFSEDDITDYVVCPKCYKLYCKDSFIDAVCQGNDQLSKSSYSSFDQITLQDLTTIMYIRDSRCLVSSLDCTEKSYQQLLEPL